MNLCSKTYFFCIINVIFFSLTGCHLFESTKVSTREIKSASSWSEKDQYPIFNSCKGEGKDEKKCFESVISSTILNYVVEKGLVASENIDSEVVLNLVIDQEGFISMTSIDSSDYVLNAIPNLESTLFESIEYIPQAKAAIKTNVGVLVSSSFKLPIRIFVQKEN